VIEFVVLKNDQNTRYFWQLAMKEFILASTSPRRKDLLRNLIDTYLIINPDIAEIRQEGETPESYVVRNCELKALAVVQTIKSSPERDWIVIAADTIVVDGDRILGKPKDQPQAVQMLTELRGKTHQVYSGIAVIESVKEEIQSRQVSSQVLMRKYTDEEINLYVSSGDPSDKAGAYAIQNPSFNPAPSFNDCYANVMGLPLCDLAAMLYEMEIPFQFDVAQRCQESIQYQCPIYPQKLAGINLKESA
jgi:MAF protein